MAAGLQPGQGSIQVGPCPLVTTVPSRLGAAGGPVSKSDRRGLVTPSQTVTVAVNHGALPGLSGRILYTGPLSRSDDSDPRDVLIHGPDARACRGDAHIS